MDREQKRTLALGVIIILTIMSAVLYFVWNLINKGTITIIAEAPYTVEVYGGETYTCFTSPCKISLETGEKDIILKKEGHESIVSEAEIKLFQDTEIQIIFQVKPHIVKADNFPENTSQSEMEIAYDKEKQIQKLIWSEDQSKRAIVYFQKELKEPQIFGSQKSALIINRGVNPMEFYKIDISNKNRELLNYTELDIKNGRWSLNGKYFIFEKQNSDKLWILNEDSIMETSISASINQIEWTADNSVVFTTNQVFESQPSTGKYGERYINLLDERLNQGFIFGYYHPDENSYTLINIFEEIGEIPQNLTSGTNKNEIYFKLGQENYKLVLSS